RLVRSFVFKAIRPLSERATERQLNPLHGSCGGHAGGLRNSAIRGIGWSTRRRRRARSVGANAKSLASSHRYEAAIAQERSGGFSSQRKWFKRGWIQSRLSTISRSIRQ